MSLTNENLEFCPICKNQIVIDSDEKYCIMCGYKVPPYTETICVDYPIQTFIGYAVPKTHYKVEPKVESDGIYIPEVEYVHEGVEPNYRLIMSKDMFIEAYIKWVAPLLPSLEEYLKGDK